MWRIVRRGVTIPKHRKMSFARLSGFVAYHFRCHRMQPKGGCPRDGGREMATRKTCNDVMTLWVMHPRVT